MAEFPIFHSLEKKETTPEKIADRIIQNPEKLQEIYEGLKVERANIKYGCLKVLRLISEEKPALLYPSYDFFVELLTSDLTFFRWGAIFILANLIAVDRDHQFEAVFERYYAPITERVMISASNVITNSARIAAARPELAGRITAEILKVEKAVYQTEECRNIAIGHAIRSFYQFFDLVEDKRSVLEFVKRQLNNPRQSTRKLAEKFDAASIPVKDRTLQTWLKLRRVMWIFFMPLHKNS